MANLFTADDTTIFEFSTQENDIEAQPEVRLAVGLEGATLAMADLTRHYLNMSLDECYPRNWRVAQFQQWVDRFEEQVDEAKNSSTKTHLDGLMKDLDRYRVLIGRSEFVWEFLKEHDDVEATTPVPEDDRIAGLLAGDVESTALNLFYAYLSDVPDHFFEVYAPTIYGR